MFPVYEYSLVVLTYYTIGKFWVLIKNNKSTAY